MKKVICFSSLLLLLLLPMLLSAQLPRGVTRPTGPGNGVPTVLNASGDITFSFSVLVANLDLVNGVACNDNYEETQTLVLPRSYPSMYLEYTIDGITDTVFVNNFERQSCAYDEWFSNNTSYFTFDHSVTVNFLDECRNGQLGLSISLSTRLLTSTGGIYPICDYISPGDIFACNSDFFPDIYCGPYSGACNSADHAEWEGRKAFRCKDIIQSNIRGSARSLDNNEENDQLQEPNLSLQVSPNPFSNQINIRLNTDIENATLRLFRVDGKLLQIKTNLDIEGNETLPLDTDHLTKGIYFLQIQNESETVFAKLIKS